MVTPIKPPKVNVVSSGAFEHVGSFLDKHVAAPVEGIGKGLSHVGEALVKGAAATVFDHVQRTFPPLALMSQPAFVKKIESHTPAPIRAALNVLSTAGESHRTTQQAQKFFFQDPMGSMRAMERQLGDALWRNPLETRTDVVRFFEALTPFTLMLPLRTLPMAPTPSVVAASQVTRPIAASHGRVIDLKPGEWSVDKFANTSAVALVGATPSMRARVAPLLPQGKSVVLPIFSSVDWQTPLSHLSSSIPTSSLPTSSLPLSWPENVTPLPGATADARPTQVVAPMAEVRALSDTPVSMGVDMTRFESLHGIDGFKAALKMPPTDFVPVSIGRSDPKLASASHPAHDYFEGMPQRVPGVISAVDRIPQWDRINYQGTGNYSYKPLPITDKYFVDNMKALYDPRWFKVKADHGEIVIKALGNNTFHVDRHGVLRYYLHPAATSVLDERALMNAVAGLLNHYGAKGQVPTVSAVQTYSEIRDGSLAQPLMKELRRQGAKWQGFTENDLMHAWSARQENFFAVPTVTPSAPLAAESKAQLLFAAAQSVARDKNNAFSEWGMNRPLMIEAGRIGFKSKEDVLVMTYGREGLHRTWKFPSVNDPARIYRYDFDWTYSNNTLPMGLFHHIDPNLFKTLERHLPKPWEMPDFNAKIPSHFFESHPTVDGLKTAYNAEHTSINASLNNGQLEYDITFPDEVMSWSGESSVREQLKENAIVSLLGHLQVQRHNPAQWVVKVGPSDADFWIYSQKIEAGESSAAALMHTALGRAMHHMGMEPGRVLRYESDGQQILRMQFKNEFPFPDTYGDSRP